MNARIAGFLARLRSDAQSSPATLKALAADLAVLDGYAAGRAWRSLGTGDVRMFVAAEHRRGLAPSSLKRMLSSWRKFFAALALDSEIDSNPAVGVRAPRRASRLPRTLSPDEAGALLDQQSDNDLQTRDQAMFELAYSSALRVGELMALDCADVDVKERMLNVAHGKGDKQRIVPVGAKAVAALDAWMLVRAKWQLGPAGALFVGRTGRRLTTRSAQLRLKALAQRAGLDGSISPHMLRHSCASHLLQSSGDLRSVQEMLGHADVGSTQIYTHLDFQALAKVYDAAHPRARRNKTSSD